MTATATGRGDHVVARLHGLGSIGHRHEGHRPVIDELRRQQREQVGHGERSRQQADLGLWHLAVHGRHGPYVRDKRVHVGGRELVVLRRHEEHGAPVLLHAVREGPHEVGVRVGGPDAAAPLREIAAPQSGQRRFGHRLSAQVLAVALDAQRHLVDQIPPALERRRVVGDLQGWRRGGICRRDPLTGGVEDVADGRDGDDDEKADDVEEIFEDTLHE